MPWGCREVHRVLLQHEVTEGVEILSVRGPVSASDAPALAAALVSAIELQPRGVLVDLVDAGELAAEAVEVLDQAAQQATGWPRPALVVCSSRSELDAQVAALDLPVHADRRAGLSHVDDRSAAPRRTVRLPHSLESPARARAMAADAVKELSCEDAPDEVALVVSELVTNAVRYAEPPVELEIEVTDDAVLIAVNDGSPGRPAAPEPSEAAEGGRGLLLVDLLADETGVRPQPPGKTVWASLPRDRSAT
jgi:anti-sigma regulatory factor (Ser/Thr protein kinase)